MKVVGLDLSLTGSGIASTAGWADTLGRDGITKMSLRDRCAVLRALRTDILTWIGAPDLVVVEGPSLRSASRAAVETHALWWAIVDKLLGNNVPVAVAAPSNRMMYATGKGLASKAAVVEAVTRRWPQYQTGGDDNLADAVVLCCMGADWLGEPLCPMPATHRRALDKVDWPEVAR